MALKNPPEVNGVMELTEEKIAEIKVKLEEIQVAFEPTDEEPALSLHGLVSRYNNNNEFKINGDTATACLEAVTDSTPAEVLEDGITS